MTAPDAGRPVAVLGGYGGVGLETVRLLRGMLPGTPIRVGGRRADAAADVVSRELAGGGEAVAVDLWDDAALTAFCAGARVVVNCAGPSYRVLDRVARAAFAAGADYVDPGGDVPVHRRLREPGALPPGRVAVLDAGLMPGLTSILPRWLARGGRPRALTAYVGLVDRLTPAGAAEYLLTLGGEHGEAQAAWRDGARASRVLSAQSDVDLPFFPRGVNLYPYLSLETERLATDLGLRQVDWYNVFDGGGHMLAALGRLQGAMAGEGDLAAAAAELCAAAELDIFGRSPYQVLLFRLEDEGGGDRSLLLRGTDTYALTGAVAALATRRACGGEIPPGLHWAEQALPGDEVAGWLRGLPAVTAVETLDSGVEVGAADEGEL